MEGNLAVVQYLVNHGADMNAQDYTGRTAQGWAMVGHTVVVEYLESVSKR